MHILKQILLFKQFNKSMESFHSKILTISLLKFHVHIQNFHSSNSCFRGLFDFVFKNKIEK